MTLGVTVGSDSSSKEDVVVMVVARSSLIKSLSLLLISLTPKTVGSLGRMVAMVTLVGEYDDTGDTRVGGMLMS